MQFINFPVITGFCCVFTLQDHSADPGLTQPNGTLTVVDPQPPSADPQPPSADILGDLLGPLAIEGPPGPAVLSEQNVVPGVEGVVVDGAAIVPVGEQANAIQVYTSPFLLLYCIEHIIVNSVFLPRLKMGVVVNLSWGLPWLPPLL